MAKQRSGDPTQSEASAATAVSDSLDPTQSEASAATSTPPVAAPAAPAPVVTLVLMPEAQGRTDRAATDLLLEACDKWGVHPGADHRPRELASWKYYPADVLEDVPAAVVLVTAGGMKLKYFVGDARQDPDTDERLRNLFKAFAIDKVTKQVVPLPLPVDQTLSAEAVTGQAGTPRHRHDGGYLRRQTA